MAGTATSIRLGAAWVTFGSIAGPIGEVIDLGYTKGNVTFTLETTVREITVDQEGISPVAATILGRRVTVDVPMAETDYARLQKIIPESTYAAPLMEINAGLGSDLMDYADTLKITSKMNANDWITVYKAAPVASLRATFAPDGERIWPVQFIGFIPEVGHAKAGILVGLNYAS
jgi:hypothetical protein